MEIRESGAVGRLSVVLFTPAFPTPLAREKELADHLGRKEMSFLHAPRAHLLVGRLLVSLRLTQGFRGSVPATSGGPCATLRHIIASKAMAYRYKGPCPTAIISCGYDDVDQHQSLATAYLYICRIGPVMLRIGGANPQKHNDLHARSLLCGISTSSRVVYCRMWKVRKL